MPRALTKKKQEDELDPVHEIKKRHGKGCRCPVCDPDYHKPAIKREPVR